jgi:hypothetical protein
MTRVIKGLDLASCLLAAFILDLDVIRSVRAQRRVEAGEINAFVRETLTQGRQVVALEQVVGGDGLGEHSASQGEGFRPRVIIVSDEQNENRGFSEIAGAA